MKNFWYGFCSIMQTRLYWPEFSDDEKYELGQQTAMLVTAVVGAVCAAFCLMNLLDMLAGRL